MSQERGPRPGGKCARNHSFWPPALACAIDCAAPSCFGRLRWRGAANPAARRQVTSGPIVRVRRLAAVAKPAAQAREMGAGGPISRRLTFDAATPNLIYLPPKAMIALDHNQRPARANSRPGKLGRPPCFTFAWLDKSRAVKWAQARGQSRARRRKRKGIKVNRRACLARLYLVARILFAHLLIAGAGSRKNHIFAISPPDHHARGMRPGARGEKGRQRADLAAIASGNRRGPSGATICMLERRRN